MKRLIGFGYNFTMNRFVFHIKNFFILFPRFMNKILI